MPAVQIRKPMTDPRNTTLRAGLDCAEDFFARAQSRVSDLVQGDKDGLNRHQFAAHGLAWVATYTQALRQTLAWVEGLNNAGKCTELESLMADAAFGEYLSQLLGGIALSQGEIIRPSDMGMRETDLAGFDAPKIKALMADGNTMAKRQRIAELIKDGNFGDWGLEDETHILVRDQFSRFSDEQIAPFANDWHLANDLIPDGVLDQMSELGVFGLTIDEAHGGLAMGRAALCIVTEELSRGYLGVGSLPTRTEIAAELIRMSGTDDQKARFLPAIASGDMIPTAVFTEPDTGSDLGGLRTKAVRDGDTWRISGQKTWITHGARSDLMTLLVRTKPDETGWRGLSMFLAVKPRGTVDDPFPATGMTGTEIGVLGYRGMHEYEISFDQFEVPHENLLGGVEGEGFKQLMQTFESARIQTAARANGVAQNALELAVSYAHDRKQFGQSIANFDRISGKLGWMAVEIMVSRQLAFFAAREKDSGRRCDGEAGMAKLFAARAAWSAADNAVQVHGGNGYALEFPVSRLLLDARILNIFEGAAEIQAHVIARAILADRN
ncbi:MAG: acyl-CoA dehydrogenase [Rhodospirillales bacterium]|nr:acyl-CoA dehydrogenase [Rhodospirillales bacterium]MBT4006724.1 acyl-CoA dehydrogenase [Rhodospirillales bacterium]MBT5076938.1 acyl-CoA dehydrogenase [Rhodospirillales bacterium]MBT5114002.1 acyl-CoA dehydrogenase [Rhodospirillales bacterium]MBT5672530.1 acyl-CoA dehydrogenase [Rhodospirillales bacterium]